MYQLIQTILHIDLLLHLTLITSKASECPLLEPYAHHCEPHAGRISRSPVAMLQVSLKTQIEA
jgi:hypothetical protein